MSEHARGQLTFNVQYKVTETSTGLPPEWLEQIVQDACYDAVAGDQGVDRWYLGQFYSDGTFIVTKHCNCEVYGEDVVWLGWADIDTMYDGATNIS